MSSVEDAGANAGSGLTRPGVSPEPRAAPVARHRVVIVADDLIWATRLASVVERAAGEPVTVRSAADIEGAAADAAIVDLTATGYPPVEAIRMAVAAGLPVIAVGPHEDLPLRREALAAGAERVFAYRKLFEDGPRVIGAWLGTAGTLSA